MEKITIFTAWSDVYSTVHIKQDLIMACGFSRRNFLGLPGAGATLPFAAGRHTSTARSFRIRRITAMVMPAGQGTGVAGG